MGGKGSGAANERNFALQAFIDDMADVNQQLKQAGHMLMRIFARKGVPLGCYTTLFAALQDELNSVHMRALRLERHARDELHERGVEDRRLSGVLLKYKIRRTGGGFASARHIKTKEDADKLVSASLPNILPKVEAKVIVGDGEDRVSYEYSMEPEEYCAAFVKSKQKQVVSDLKKVLREVKKTLGEMEEAEC